MDLAVVHLIRTTLAIIETAFDEAWLTLKCDGNHRVRADELARCILRLAMEGERDAARLHERALSTLAPAMIWREEKPVGVEKLAAAP